MLNIFLSRGSNIHSLRIEGIPTQRLLKARPDFSTWQYYFACIGKSSCNSDSVLELQVPKGNDISYFRRSNRTRWFVR